MFLEIFIKVVGDPPAELRSDNAFYAFAPTFRATPLTVRVSLVEGHGAHVGGHHEDVVELERVLDGLFRCHLLQDVVAHAVAHDRDTDLGAVAQLAVRIV